MIEKTVNRTAPILADGWKICDLSEYMAKEAIPGVSLATIDDGEISGEEALGVKENGKNDPITPETRFQAASISKPVAALTALSLVQEGQLSLDEDIRKWQTSWHLPDNHNWQPRVTLRQLLSHSAGINIEGFLGYAQSAPQPSFRQVLNGETPANSPVVIVDTLPGLHFRYSGGGYCVLQQLVEDVSGIPFWQAAKERVLDRAGMSQSTYLPLSLQDPQADCAVGHRNDALPIQGGWHFHPESAAAGLWTTAHDLANLLVVMEKTLAGKTEIILSQPLLEEMLKPHIRLRGIGLEGWDGLGVFLSGEGTDIYYGHGGSNEGYRSQFIVRKGKGQAAVIMTNSDNGYKLNDEWLNTIAIRNKWEGFLYQPPVAVDCDAQSLATFGGIYRSENGLSLEVRLEDGFLWLYSAHQAPMRLAAKNNDTFFTTQINAQVRFERENETVKALVFRQNHEELRANKI